MNYYALIYETVGDYVQRRTGFRQQHLRVAQAAYERGELVLAGAFGDPVDRALLVFRVADQRKVEDFARNDPYVVNGLVKKWEVRPWTVVVGQQKASPCGGLKPGMILRHWSARTSEALLPKYLEYFSKSVRPELLGVPGFLNASVSVRHSTNGAEILVETSWDSLESIRAFAGPDLEAAVVRDEAAALLIDFDRRVRHYEMSIAV